MSGTNDDSLLPTISRDENTRATNHESLPPRYNENFISDFEEKLKEFKRQAHSNPRQALDLPDGPPKHDPKLIALSSEFKVNLQKVVTERPGLRGLMCSFEVNPNNHPYTTELVYPEFHEASWWRGVLTFREAGNPHRDREVPSLDRNWQSAQGLLKAVPKPMSNGHALREIYITWTEQILRFLKPFDSETGLHKDKYYIPCIEIQYWGVFCFRMYGTKFMLADDSVGQEHQASTFKDSIEEHHCLILNIDNKRSRINQARYDWDHPDEISRADREAQWHAENCSRHGSSSPPFSVDGPGPSNTPEKWDGTYLSPGDLKTWRQLTDPESLLLPTPEGEEVVQDQYYPYEKWLNGVLDFSNPHTPWTTPPLPVTDSSHDSH